jgi:hypothetical protein
MECCISIAAEDQGTAHIADVLRPHLESLSLRLSRDYGGSMQHLWIDVEMCPAHADRRPPWPFRFQKRVSRASTAKLLGLPMPEGAADFMNVGHYSVRPDYAELAEFHLPEIPAYVIKLIYGEAAVLERKSRRLGGFDATRFRQDILTYIDEMRSSQKRMG